MDVRVEMEYQYVDMSVGLVSGSTTIIRRSVLRFVEALLRRLHLHLDSFDHVVYKHRHELFPGLIVKRNF